jgi:methylthioribose-1-phosphate isomerase
MNIAGTPYTSIWYEAETDKVFYIDQTLLPWELVIREMKTFDDGIRAISEMEVRGAPLIGVAAAFAMYVGIRVPPPGPLGAEGGDVPPPSPLLRKEGEEDALGEYLRSMAERLIATRPTAVNLAFAVNKMLDVTRQEGKRAESQEGKDLSFKNQVPSESCHPRAGEAGSGDLVAYRDISQGGDPVADLESLGGTPSRVTCHASRLLQAALELRQAELDSSIKIGEAGLKIIQRLAARKPGKPVNILTHCNAGWLAAVDYGTALAPIYMAHDSGIPVHVWVDETRPRNQGAKLTAYELTAHGVPNTLIVDNAGGLLMQQGRVDLVIVGADRITANGDVVNKIGTYLKALAANDNRVPFYVAAPSSTFDSRTLAGKDVPIEERSPVEVLWIDDRARIAAPGTAVYNPGFDVTPARLITGYVTEGTGHKAQGTS